MTALDEINKFITFIEESGYANPTLLGLSNVMGVVVAKNEMDVNTK